MKEWIVLFLQAFLIVFVGFVFANVCALVIDCVFNSFHSFGARLAELPYVLYAAFALVFALIWAMVLINKTK